MLECLYKGSNLSTLMLISKWLCILFTYNILIIVQKMRDRHMTIVHEVNKCVERRLCLVSNCNRCILYKEQLLNASEGLKTPLY